MVVKKVIRLPGLKVEIKNIRGDGKPPKLKIVPLPGLKRLLHPPTNPGGGDGVPGGGDGGTPGG